MGGKTSQSTQSVSIPPQVLARYNSVNARAEEVAKTPFQPYTDKFVAGLNETQKSGITGTSEAANMAQPYYGAATGLTLSGAQDVGPLTKEQIAYYQNPYTEAVANPTLKALQQQQGQERAVQQAQAIKSGAAFGDRSGVARAQLAGQQNLATASALAPIYKEGYDNASDLAKSQQVVVSNDLARRMKAGEQIAGIGTTAQESALKGSAAKIAAGTVEQQTEQADLTAKYQQFLQQRGYDFQTAQFLANIAMGTGALSGSTTTTTQPTGFFSDERLKHDAHRIGETDDGLPIYSFKYNGDNKTQIGLMAQDVEKRKPEAVGLAPASDGKMYKTVDYDKATRSNKDYGGGVMGDYDPSSMGGAVAPGLAGEGFADGGMPGMGGMPGVTGYVPAANLPIGKLMTADGRLLQQNKSGLGSAVETGKSIAGLYDMGKTGLVGSAATGSSSEMPGLIGGGGKFKGENVFDWTKKQFAADGGLIVPRQGHAMGGSDDEEPTPYNPYEVMKGEDPMGDVIRAGSRLSKGLQKPGGGAGGGGQSGASQLSSALGLGTAAMNFGQQVPEFLAMFLADGGRTPFAYGGLIPRQHHADGERVIEDYSPEADLPAIGAQEAGLVVDKPDYRSIVTNAAKQGGIDEGHTVRLAHGESGLNPVIGDDGSSAGLFQLHVGGVSRKYPNPGLGDEYFRQRRPDLHEKLSPSEKVAFLNAPENQEDTAKFAAGHIAKNGAKAWTVARNQGLFGLSGDAPRPPGLVGRSERAPSSYSGKDAGQASLGDVFGEYVPKGTPTSANFWVPALAGLGSMLASKNQTLLGAVGEGLVGGVSGYQSQYKQQMDATKTVFDIIQNTFQETRDANGNVAFRNKRTGDLVAPQQVQASVSKMLEAAGIDPAFAGISKSTSGGLMPAQAETSIGADKGAPAAAPTVSGGPPRPEIPAGRQQPTLAGEAQPVPAKITDKPPEEWSATEIDQHVRENGAQYGLTGANNPITMQKRVDQLKTRAAAFSEINPAQAGIYDKQAQEEQARLDKLVERAASKQLDNNKKISEQRLGNANDFVNAIGKRDDVYRSAYSQMMELSRLQGQGLRSGFGAETQRNINSLLRTLGVTDPKYYVGSNDPVDYDYAAKIAMQQIVSNLAAAGLQRAPKAGIEVEKKITPGGSVDPGAIYSLIGQTLGDMEYVRDRDREYLAKHKNSDPTAFTFNYNDKMGERGYNQAIAKAFSQLDLPTSDKNVRNLLRNISEKYGPYGYKPKGIDTGQNDVAPAPTSGKSTTNVPWKVVQ